MPPNAVPVRTAKGMNALRSHGRRLAARARAVLGMVDGQATLADYRRRFETAPALEAALDALIRGGFIDLETSADERTVQRPPRRRRWSING